MKTGLGSIEYAMLDGDVAKDLPFLDALAFPRTEQIREDLHGVQHKSSLIQHDALGPLPCSGIGNLGSGGQPAFREILKHLGGPDHRHMGGLTDAENIFLDQGQMFEAHLDGEVPSRNHDAEFRVIEPRKKKLCQAVNGLSRLDFDDDSQIGMPEVF